MGHGLVHTPRIAVGLVCLLVMAGPVFAEPTDPPTAAPVRPSDYLASYDAAVARLAKPVQLHLDEIPLDNVIEFFVRFTGEAIDIDYKALELIGVPRDKPITLKAAGLSARTGLDMVLQRVNTDIETGPVSIEWLGDRWLIAPRLQVIRAASHARVYSVPDLLDISDLAFTYSLKSLTKQRMQGFPEPAPQLVGPATQPSVQGAAATETGQHPGGGFDADDEVVFMEDLIPTAEFIETLHVVIMDSVGDPDDWLNEIATIREYDGHLVISAPTSYHAGVRDLLQAIRRAKAEARVLEQAVVRDAAIHHAAAAERARRAGDLQSARRELAVAIRLMPDDPVVRGVARAVQASGGEPAEGSTP